MTSTPKIFRTIFVIMIALLANITFGQITQVLEKQIQWDDTKENGFGHLTFVGGTLYDALPNTDMFYESNITNNTSIATANLLPGRVATVTVDPAIGKQIVNTEYQYTVDITEVRGKHYLNTMVLPWRKLPNGQIERLLDFKVNIEYQNSKNPSFRNPEATFTSVLADGDIFKISVQKSGIHKIDKTFLESKLGINTANLNPKKIKIYGNRGGRVPEANSADRIDDLGELRIFVSGEGDGTFDAADYILFYAEGADIWNYDKTNNAFTFDKNIYDDNNYYFIKIDNQDGLRVVNAGAINDTPDFQTSTFDMLQRLEEDKTNLLGTFTGTEGTGKSWYGDIFKGTREKTYTTFDFSDIDISQPMEVEMLFAGRGASPSSVLLSIGSKIISKSIGSVSVINAESLYARNVLVKESFLTNTATPSIKISYPATSSETEGWLDYLQITCKKSLRLNSTQMTFRNRESINANITAFTVSNFSNQVIWDITNPLEPINLPVVGNKLVYKTQNMLHEFVAHNQLNGALEPIALGKIPNQNLHSIENEDMILVYHANFKSEALRLATHRQNQSGIKVRAVETNEVYNEFSSGRVDPGAIRDMARLLLSRNPNYKYLLLFGDGSYDYKGLVNGLSPENFVPVYETDESLNPIEGFPADDFYGLLGAEEGAGLKGSMDIYVGRLPAKTPEEATVLVDKIIHYETSSEVLGDWRLRTGYTADDEDGNTHLRDMDEIARSDEARHTLYNQQKVYLDAFTQVSTAGETRYPEANKALNDNTFKGQLSLTYLGHGGPLGWAQERVLTVPDIQSWENYNSLSVMVTATCSFAAYDDPEVVTPAEYAILNPKGGAIALLSTTRAVYTSSNKLLTDAAHELMLKKKDGKAPTLGYILAEGKNKYQGTSFQTNSRKFTLLGDPSMPIAMPKLNVYTSTINGQPTTTIDTLSALEKVTINGYIGDDNGEIASSFNGTIFPTIYDKKSQLETLSNDASSGKFTYSVYKNIIFKGAATVTNGQWSFSFWVPKNINYTYGNGRISYYATDGNTIDAGGVFTNVIIGGSNKAVAIDDQGPKIDIYMNDQSFVYGGMTNSDPILLLELSDDFGINVTGNAIGQDITAILDGNDQNVFILNDFYEAAKDDFTSGKVRFPLTNIEKGQHSLVAKAWDISGNSAETRTEFIVAENGDDVLRHVLNYPNPFTTHTFFQFEHDLVNSEVEVLVQIYTMTGKLVKSIGETKYSSGFRVNDIGWNGRDDYDSKLAKGIYLYKVKVHSKELNLTRESGFEKLVIL